MRRSAFTLIELMVVLAIIMILASIGYAAMERVMFSAKRGQTQVVLAKVDAAIRVFRSDVGFYPKGEYAKPPFAYETTGYAKGLIQTDAASGLPVAANDDVWSPAGTLSVWEVGNGLFARLGEAESATSVAAKALTTANAESLRKVEMERFYHIGHFGDMSADSLGLGLSGYLSLSAWNVTDAARSKWVYYDLVGPSTAGERELKRIMDHYRMAPRILTLVKVTTPVDTPWTTTPPSALVTTTQKNNFASEVMSLYASYVALMRPRDAADAYRRAMRNGVDAGPVAYDIPYVVPETGPIAATQFTPASITIAASSSPWSGGYITDLEARYVRDVDGDGKVDVLDAYGNPLVYINEGLPASPMIVPPPPVASKVYYSRVLHYHPDPDKDPGPLNAHSCNPNTSMMYVTDKDNGKGVVKRYDAMDISVISDQFGINYTTVSNVGAFNGLLRSRFMDPKMCGEPYVIAGTSVPSRMRVKEVPDGVRSIEMFYNLSKDGSKIVEPFHDANGNGQWDSGEAYIDRMRVGNVAPSYHDNVGPNDMRLCAVIGEEREFELWSAGPGGKFSALRQHDANADNIRTRTRK